VVVEPTRVAFSKLSNLYLNNESVLCVNCAIGNKKQKIKINVNGNHIGENDTGLLSTVKDEEKTRWKGEIWETEEIDMVTYQNLISIVEGATNDVGFSFDFISIDAEGCDIDILKQIDLRLVRMVCIEWNGVEENKTVIDSICRGYGMTLHYKNAENLIYARNKA
jgi:FkbM family methyltransferase